MGSPCLTVPSYVAVEHEEREPHHIRRGRRKVSFVASVDLFAARATVAPDRGQRGIFTK